MRLVLHHLRKDLRAMWPLMTLWIGVLSIHLLVPVGDPSGGAVQTERLQSLLLMAQWALAAALPALLILQDPVPGARAFWLTRPISRPGLLASKLLFLGLFFILLPLAFQLVGMVRAGFGGWVLAAGLAEAALAISGIVLAFAALASLSSSLARFALLLAVCFVGAAVVGPAILAIAPAADLPGWTSLWQSRDVARMVMLLLLAAALLVHQWLTRGTDRSYALAGVAVLALSWASVWPWDFLAPPARPLKGDQTLDLQPADDPRCAPRGADVARVTLCGRLLLGEAAASLDLEIERLDSRLVLPGGTAIEHRAGGRGGRVVSRLDDGGDPPSAWSPLDAIQTLLTPPRELYREHARAPGTLEVELVLASFEVQELGALPIEQGARLRTDATATALDRIVISAGPPATVELEVRLHRVELLLAPWTWSRQLDASLEHRVDRPPLTLTSGNTSRRASFLALLRPRLHTARERQTLRFRYPGDPGESAPAGGAPSTAEEVRQWLRDARLVVRQRVRTGTYRAHLRLDDFRMADYARPEDR